MMKRSKNKETRKRTRISLSSYHEHNHSTFKNTAELNSAVSMTQEELTSDVQWGSLNIPTNLKNLGKVERERGFGISNDDITHPLPLFRTRSIPRRFLPRTATTDDSNSLSNEDTNASLQKLIENIGSIKSPVDTNITEVMQDSMATNTSALSVSNQVEDLATNKPEALSRAAIPSSVSARPDIETSHQKLTQHSEKYSSMPVVTPQYRKSFDYRETMSLHSKNSAGTHPTANISEERTTVLQDVMLSATDDYDISLAVNGESQDMFAASQILPYLKYGVETENNSGIDSQPDLAHSTVLFSTTAATSTVTDGGGGGGGRTGAGISPWLPVVAEHPVDSVPATEGSANKVSEIKVTSTTVTSSYDLSNSSYSFKSPNSSRNHNHTSTSSLSHIEQTKQQQQHQHPHQHHPPASRPRAQESPEEVTEEFMLLLEQMEAEARLSTTTSTTINHVNVIEINHITKHSSTISSTENNPSIHTETHISLVNKKSSVESESSNNFEVCEDISLEELRLLEDMEAAAITLFAEKRQLSQQQNQQFQQPLQSSNTISSNKQQQVTSNGASTTLSGLKGSVRYQTSNQPSHPQYQDAQKENINPQSNNTLRNRTASALTVSHTGQSQQSYRSFGPANPDMVDRMFLDNMKTIDLSLLPPLPPLPANANANANANASPPTATVDTLLESPPPPPPPLSCHRYIALEVVEHASHDLFGRCKEVRCFAHNPTTSTTTTTTSARFTITNNTTATSTDNLSPFHLEEFAAHVTPPALLPQHLKTMDRPSSKANNISSHSGRSRPHSKLDENHHHHPHKRQSIWLQGDWMDCEIRGGDVFHIVHLAANDIDLCTPSAPRSQSPTICVSNTSGLLVLHPDTLISPTKIVESCGCVRKAVLSERIRSLGGTGLAAVMGNVKHEFVESLMDLVLPRLTMTASPGGNTVAARPLSTPQTPHPPARQPPPPPLLSDQEFSLLLQSTLRSHVEELWATGVTEQQLRLELGSLVPPLLTWLTQSRSGNTATRRPVADDSSGAAIPPLKSVAGVEEVLWSPPLGIKGQIDLVMCDKLPANRAISSTGSGTGTDSASCHLFPIEIKTGKWRPSVTLPHRAQVILYVLMLLVRQRTSSSGDCGPSSPSAAAAAADFVSLRKTLPVGMLLYVSDVIRCEVVTPCWDDMRALMITRNNLAVHLKKTFDLTTHLLPPLLRNRNDCENCYQASECLLTHLARQQGTAQTSGVEQLFGYLLRGLSAVHVEYFRHWQTLLDLEAVAEETRRGKTVWIQNAGDLSGQGIRSLGGLTVVSMQQPTATTGTTGTTSGDTILTLRIAGREGKGGGRNGLFDQPPASPQSTDAAAVPVNNSTNSSLNNNNNSSSSYNNSVFNVDDRVVVSVEYTHTAAAASRSCGSGGRTYRNPSAPTSSSSSSSNHVSPPPDADTNIEDLLAAPHPPSSLPSVEPCVCTGTLLQVTEDCIQLTVPKSLRRLQWLLGSGTGNPPTLSPSFSSSSSGWTIRLDEDHSYNNIATLRANVYSLFVSPHDPKEYAKYTPPTINPNPTPNSNSRASSLPASNATGAHTTHTVSSTHNYANINDQEYTASTILANNSNCSNSNVTYSKFRLRQLIVDLQPPLFDSPPPPLRVDSFDSFMALLDTKQVKSEESNWRNMLSGNSSATMTSSQQKLPSSKATRVFAGCDPRQLWREFHAMNAGQQQAVLRVLLAKDYVLLLGMPGTGKSSTLAFVIRCLVARGDRVLLTAYTHAAIDHVLLKLQESGVSEEVAARIGSPVSVPAALHRYLLKPGDGSHNPNQVMQAFTQRIATTRLVLCSALTASRSLVVSGLQFEWCVVDEAGQISQPAALGPVMAARKFVLVGDHYQLPPLVVSVEAQSKGMAVSLFKRLAEAHPEAVTCLTVQYRMNTDIMALCNRLIYNHRLRCGNSKVASSRLHLPHFPAVAAALQSSAVDSMRKSQGMASDLCRASTNIDWLLRCIDPLIAVVFVNTDDIITHSISAGGSGNTSAGGQSMLTIESINDNNGTDSLSTKSSRSSSSNCGGNSSNSSSQQDSNNNNTSTSSSTTSSTSNAMEARLVGLMVEVLVRSGCFPSHSLGLLSPFRDQVAVLQAEVDPLTLSLGSPFSATSMPATATTATTSHDTTSATTSASAAAIQIATVDKFQGKDVDVLIISTVKSVRDKSPGDLLSDWRRINVALTRDWLITPTWTDVSLAAVAVKPQSSSSNR